MRIISGLKKRRYVAIVSVFLITIILISGMAGCGGFTIRLTITSTEGGSVTVPGEGTFIYSWGQCCPGQKLVAEAEEGYRFVEWTGEGILPDDPLATSTDITMDRDSSITANFGHECTPMVAAGGKHTVGLNDVGRVVAMGDNSYGQCNVGDWTQIIQLAAGAEHTVGVRAGGMAVATGLNGNGQCNIAGWTDIPIKPIVYADLGLPCPRPPYSPLDNMNLRLQDFELATHYMEPLKEYVKWLLDEGEF